MKNTMIVVLVLLVLVIFSGFAPPPPPPQCTAVEETQHNGIYPVGMGLIDGKTFNAKPIQFSIINGLAVFEGDIILGTEEQLARTLDPQFSAVYRPGSRWRWPSNIVPYEIDPCLPNQSRVTAAIRHWRDRSNIRFVQKTSSHANYVFFTTGSGCTSYVGMQGGKQPITLAAGCRAAETIHEIGHAIGLWHEQSREDRNNYIEILWQNISDGQSHNFNQHINDGDDLGPYDYRSIMHYRANAFSKNGQPTMRSLTATPVPAQNGTALSEGDRRAADELYP